MHDVDLQQTQPCLVSITWSGPSDHNLLLDLLPGSTWFFLVTNKCLSIDAAMVPHTSTMVCLLIHISLMYEFLSNGFLIS